MIIEQNFHGRQVVLGDHGEDGAAPVPRQPKAPPRALLEPHELAEIGPPEAVRLPIDLIDPSPANPRRALIEIESLAESIRDPGIGLLQPILVRRLGERYEILAGHRRWAAVLLLREQEPVEPQWRTIPAVVRTAGDEAAYLMLISAQVHNRQWQPKEEAAALEALAVEHTLSQIGNMVHKGESWVSKRLRLYSDAILSPLVQTGRLAAGVAEEFLTITDKAVKQDLAERAVAESWSVVEARKEVRTLKLHLQLSHVGRQARDLFEVLSSINAASLPRSASDDLVKLARRIMFLATGQEPIFPSIDAARKSAGVSDKPSRRQRNKPKRRIPPPPA